MKEVVLTRYAVTVGFIVELTVWTWECARCGESKRALIELESFARWADSMTTHTLGHLREGK